MCVLFSVLNLSALINLIYFIFFILSSFFSIILDDKHPVQLAKKFNVFYHPGNYSVYGFEINLSRSLGPFILSVYLPSAMFVMMSWVSFFIPPVGIVNPILPLCLPALRHVCYDVLGILLHTPGRYS